MIKENIYGAEQTGKRRTWILAVPVMLWVLLTAGQVLTALPAKWLGLISRDTIETYPTILYFLAVTFASGGAMLLLWVRYFEGRSLKSIGLTFEGWECPRFGAGYGAGLLLACLSVLGIWAVGGYALERAYDVSAVSYGPIFLLMLAFCVQSSVEEIFFRGWMLERVSARYGLWVGILANATLFTLMHVDDETLTWPNGAIFAVMTMAFSIFLSLLAVRQKTVWGACAWHAAWNWLYITWFGLPTTGIGLDITPLAPDLKIADGAPTWLTGGAMGPENSVVTMLVLLVGCAWMALGHQRRKAAALATAE